MNLKKAEKVFYTLSLLLLSLSVFAQNEEKAVAHSKTRKLAEYAYSENNYYPALDYYLELEKTEPDNPEYIFRIAECYSVLHKYKMAAEYYKKVIDTDSLKYPKSRIYYANMLKLCGDYENALFNYTLIYKTYRDTNADVIRAKAKDEIADCKWAIGAVRDTVIQVYALDSVINTANSDMAPVSVDPDHFIYSSYPSDSSLTRLSGKKQKNPFIKLFLASKNQSGFYERKPLDIPDIGKKNPVHQAGGSFSKDKRKFFYTVCSETNNQGAGQKIQCSIYSCDYNEGKFLNPVKLNEEINMKDYSSSQPCIGTHKGDEILFFTSSRPGGQGGSDIWFTVIKNKTVFLPPVNIGTKINTSGNETTPFYDDSSKTLYFSSDGWRNFGGLDIMKSEGSITKWKKCENLGLPINSSADDFYFFPESVHSGYFVSNRPDSARGKTETCCDDIYRFEPVAIKVKRMAVRGFVRDNQDSLNQAMKFAVVSLYDTEGALLARDTTFDALPYFFGLQINSNYTIRVSAGGYEEKSIPFSTFSMEADTVDLLILMQKKKQELIYFTDTTAKAISIEEEEKTSFTLKNILYDFNKATLKPKSIEELNKFAAFIKLFPGRVIEISSHTDSVGSDEYNLILSQKRAESVVNYLVRVGINQNQLEAKGYGETNPVAPNSNPDGSDNPDGRQLNRRTDFKILGTIENKRQTKVK